MSSPGVWRHVSLHLQTIATKHTDDFGKFINYKGEEKRTVDQQEGEGPLYPLRACNQRRTTFHHNKLTSLIIVHPKVCIKPTFYLQHDCPLPKTQGEEQCVINYLLGFWKYRRGITQSSWLRLLEGSSACPTLLPNNSSSEKKGAVMWCESFFMVRLCPPPW